MVTTNPDIPAAEKTWSSKRTVFEWDSVRHADTYYVSIIDRNQKEHELRIVETTALKPGQTIPGPVVQIQEKVVVQNGAQTTERWQIVQIDADGDGKAEEDVIFRDQMTKPGEPERTLALNFDQVQVKENYLDANGAVYRYETVLSAQLQITPSADGTSYRYTFALPDVESISDEKGSRVTGAKKYSKLIRFRADVLANAQTDQSLQSDAYVSSDEKTIQLDK